MSVSTMRFSISSFNCSLPGNGTHFIDHPPVRGTLDIAWSCLGVLVLSTWETLLTYVPEPAQASARYDRYKRLAYRYIAKLGMMLATLLAPEFLFALAVIEFMRAWRLRTEGREWAKRDNVPWTLRHAYFAVIRGFRVENVHNGTSGGLTAVGSPVESESSMTISPRTPDSNKGLLISFLRSNERAWQSSEETVSEVIWPVKGPQLMQLREKDLINSWPHITTEELDDKDKDDPLVRTLAIVQIIWLIAQTFSRASRALPNSQLEIVTVAYAVTSFLIRAVAWQRPRDVRTTIRIPTARYIEPQEVDAVTAATDNYDDSILIAGIVGLCVGAVFGGLHALAWSATFPTPAEKLLWRYAVILIATLPMIMPLFLVMYYASFDGQSSSISMVAWVKGSIEVVAALMLVVYCLARLYTIVEAARSLFFQPPETFVSTWAFNFPHFG